VQITHDGTVKRGHLIAQGGPDAALFTDGVNVHFTEGTSDAPELAEVSALGGETAKIPVSFGQPGYHDFKVEHHVGSRRIRVRHRTSSACQRRKRNRGAMGSSG